MIGISEPLVSEAEIGTSGLGPILFRPEFKACRSISSGAALVSAVG